MEKVNANYQSISPFETDGQREVNAAPKKLGLYTLCILAFYSVNGGAFGIEDIVRAGGPFYALCGFSLMIVWAVPEALITAELSTALPDASGSVAWVDAAFGEFWAFQKGWLSWLSGISDNALYPILFFDCLLSFLRANQSSQFDDSISVDSPLTLWLTDHRMSLILFITLTLTALNYRGLDVVGNVVMFICFCALFPFLLFVICGLPSVEPSRWLISPPGGLGGVDWRLLLNTFFWNINYWESASCFSADVESPGTVYPKGMLAAVLLVFLASFLPVLVGTGASPDPYTSWHDGYFTHLATKIVGPWLGCLLMFGATMTNIGMFEAEMSSDAWQVAGMADKGILPKILGERNRYGVPTYGVGLSALGVVLLGSMTFTAVIEMLNLLYCLGQIIEFCAFLHLRATQPDLHRPYKVPMGLFGVSVMLSFPLIFIGIILYFATTLTLVLTVLCAVCGVGAYYLLKMAKQRQWCDFSVNEV